VQSHLYSFSFEKNPRWSRMFAGQKEIRAYLEHCATKYDLRSHLRFDSEVTSARFDERCGVWTVTLASGERIEADHVVLATGGLSRPAYPDIVGIEGFQGKLFHSARWDHDYDLAGKAVGVIGTGASAIQFVPQIAPRVKALHLFQRTPPWILPKPDRPIGGFEQLLYRFLPFVQWLYRFFLYWFLELRVLGFVVNPKLMALPQRVALAYLERSVPDPVLRAKLTPKYTIGCKRILMSNDYFQSLVRPNVEVVDTGIAHVTSDGVVTRDGQHRKLDALILGTGFQASEAVAPFEIRGKGGVELNDHWREGAEAYAGTTVSGFPNLFIITGPNTGLGHSSMVFMIEAGVDHIMACLGAVRRSGAKQIEVRPGALRRYNDDLQAGLQKAVWSSGCSSWYVTKSGKNTTLWPSFTFAFRSAVARIQLADYELGGNMAASRAVGADSAMNTSPVAAE
jgi:cation diffusion facilitator CzcD-associated flavoprotein CzcO